MAGSMISAESELQEKSLNAMRDQWEVQYSRFFSYPSNANTSSSQSHLCIRRNRSKGTWLSSCASANASLHTFTDRSKSSDTILAVYFQGKILEEHFISKLHFTWPQVSCVSGFPPRGSLVIFVSYKDCADEIQKFALRFSAINATKTFIAHLEEAIFKIKDVSSFTSDISSQSEFVPPQIPSVMTPIDTSEILEMAPISKYQTPISPHTEVEQLPCSQDFGLCLNSEGHLPSFPPRFTSLVTNCCSQIEQGNVAAAASTVSAEVDFKSKIAKYMQDASFLDMLSKVEEVIDSAMSWP
ncbi:hypothetical protein Nepgr_003409 [Nepenthes gracilis]|uniref:Poor homologous synapsis 1 PH domain-containing protein n=1 Tax=Nepenthes gracilis TaxID=150966 RepID=A0AAD3RZI2_NEPGR|nr:hypothetical protein Nepgr_003409 [Nepenthes gracilis]